MEIILSQMVSRRPTKVPESISSEEILKADPQVVIRVVCNHFGISQYFLMHKCRKRDLVDARHYIHYLLSLTPITLNEIKKHTGVLNHSSVIHSRNIIEQWTKIYPEVNEKVKMLYDQIKESC